MADTPVNAANLSNGVTDGQNMSVPSAPQIPFQFNMWDGGLIGDLFGIGSSIERTNKQAWDRYNAQRAAYEYERNLQFSHDEAEIQRNWEKLMSDTATQRKMADLAAAGINPLLAVSGASSGASTPSGSSARAGGMSSGSGKASGGSASHSAGALMGGAALIKAVAKAGATAAGEMIGETAPEWFLALA